MILFLDLTTTRLEWFSLHSRTVGLLHRAGQEDYDSPQLLSMDRCVSSFFFVTSTFSFKTITSKWYPDIKLHCPDTSMILVGRELTCEMIKKTLLI